MDVAALVSGLVAVAAAVATTKEVTGVGLTASAPGVLTITATSVGRRTFCRASDAKTRTQTSRNEHSASCPCRKSNTNVVMVQAAEDRYGFDAPEGVNWSPVPVGNQMRT